MQPTKPLALFLLLLATGTSCAQPLGKKPRLTMADTLRGSITPERQWWDVLHYNIVIEPHESSKTIAGKNTIRFQRSPGTLEQKQMQIDLQHPMRIDSVLHRHTALSFTRRGNTYLVAWPLGNYPATDSISIYFQGQPQAAKNPPWDGGWIWKEDRLKRPWVSVAVQGLGASAWYPCKDHQSDEPDSGAQLTVKIPNSLVAVSNGRLMNKKVISPEQISYTWAVKNPINSYNVVPYIGNYINFGELYKGEKGDLICNYWVLDYNKEKAVKQFTQVSMTLKAFEYWFGPFPWYEDGFKLVEAPHLGMEHQSAVAYGNKFGNGYLGNDLSGTGVGKKWDFIIVHEVGHEWFGNNITAKDIADMWIHEGFTSYSEVLFAEFHFGKKDANKYVQGIRKNIRNDMPIIGPYGVNREGSSDMYYKGSNMIHTIRQVIDNDSVFRNILRGLNKTFYHQTVTTAAVENYISKESRCDFSKVFDQYLRGTKIPQLQFKTNKGSISYQWADCVNGFNMPVKVYLDKQQKDALVLTPQRGVWKELRVAAGYDGSTFIVDPDFYVGSKRVAE